MKIAIDVDDVLIETFLSIVKNYNKEKGTNFSLEDITSYMIWEVGIYKDKKEAMREVLKLQNNQSPEEIRVMKDSLKVLKILKEEHDFLIITSRHRMLKEKTKEILDFHFGIFGFDIRHSGDFFGVGKPKSEICIEEECEIILEDSLNIAIDCADKGIKTILFDKPWNRSEIINKNIFRVNDWNEALQKINEIEKLKDE